MSDRLYKLITEADVFTAPSQDEIIQRWATQQELTRNSDGSFNSVRFALHIQPDDPVIRKGKLIITFDEVQSFDCNHCHLKTLEGSPRKVNGFFSCSYNPLKNLDGAPKEVGGDFWIKRESYRSRSFTEKEVRAVCDVKGKVYV